MMPKQMNLEDRVADLERRMAAIERSVHSGENSPVLSAARKMQSPKEFVLERRPKSEIDATFLFGCYAEFAQKLGSFDVDDIRGLFQGARMAVPANVNDAINKNIAKGLFTAAPQKKNGKKAWVVTLSGEERFKKGNG